MNLHSRIPIASIVEGQGEVQALPALLHRLAIDAKCTIDARPPVRLPAGKLLRDTANPDFRRAVETAARPVLPPNTGLVVILFDSEDDCPSVLGQEVLHKAQSIRNDARFLVVAAFREFETWFLAAARSLRGVANLPGDVEPPANPEGIRDAKGWLSSRMRRKYQPTSDQLALVRRFDLDQAASMPSFHRFRRRFASLLDDLNPANPTRRPHAP